MIIMKTITIERQLFTYAELDEKVQEKVARRLLEEDWETGYRDYIFEIDAKQEAEMLSEGIFKVNKVYYDLSYSRADFVGFEGVIDVLLYLEKNEKELKYQFWDTEGKYPRKNYLTDEDFLLLKEIFTNTYDEGFYICDEEGFADYNKQMGFGAEDDIRYIVGTDEETNEREILRLLEILGSDIAGYYEEIADKIKEMGYNFFYEITEDDVDRLENLYYLEDGTPYCCIEDLEN